MPHDPLAELYGLAALAALLYATGLIVVALDRRRQSAPPLARALDALHNVYVRGGRF